ncbi:hypothetical protein [Coralliovum pocilloporae]|uniref:hypothetical protein n=1 Tax=Coralliovum pocilloporae TaxID=3066369 RepID=UPI003307B201
MITDEMIVAVLDGEADENLRQAVEDAVDADPNVAARVDLLAAGERPFAEAYDLVLEQTDQTHLAQLLKTAEESISKPALTVENTGTVIPWRRLSALAAVLVLGVGLGFGSSHLSTQTQQTQIGWRQAVADYQALYTKDTLDLARQTTEQQTKILATVSERLGRPLTLEGVNLDGLSYRRAQILNFKGKALAQLAYLSGEDAPIAFCIVASDKGAKPMATETRNGLNIAFWNDGSHAYMIIGDLDEESLKKHAAALQAGLTS